MSHFKSQQEVMKYLVGGGSVTIGLEIVKFINGKLNYGFTFADFERWQPYIEPVAKTKVWCWEHITTSSSGTPCIYQRTEHYTEADAAKYLPSYTKVPGSEREI